SLESGERKILLSSFAAISGVGLLSYAALPILLSSTMTNLDINEESVGILFSLEFIAATLSSIIIAPKIGKINRTKIAFIGAFIVIAGNLASGLWSNYGFLLLIRPITGIGAGLALASGNATIANSKHPAKIAGMMNVLFAALLALLMLYLSYLNESWGIQGIYFGLAAMTFSFLFFLRLMPQRSTQHDSETVSNKINSTGIFSIAGIAIFAVFFMFTLRDSMAWAFADRIGNVVGYSSNEMGQLLSLQAFIGLVGPIITAIIGFKFGVRFPLLLGIVFAGLTSYAIFLSPELPYLFEGSVLVWTAGYFFAISYLTAYAATLDLDGRIVADSGSAMVLGVAAGPALSGYLITKGGYDLAAWATLALVVLMIISTIVSLKWRIETQEE
ncbi:MAG: MFS transporter, partial [Cyclobacteriaceae bacterium]|nr:MFS transporter [Cyclobacteriaceae bacterium]